MLCSITKYKDGHYSDDFTIGDIFYSKDTFTNRYCVFIPTPYFGPECESIRKYISKEVYTAAFEYCKANGTVDLGESKEAVNL